MGLERLSADELSSVSYFLWMNEKAPGIEELQGRIIEDLRGMADRDLEGARTLASEGMRGGFSASLAIHILPALAVHDPETAFPLWLDAIRHNEADSARLAFDELVRSAGRLALDPKRVVELMHAHDEAEEYRDAGERVIDRYGGPADEDP